MNKVLKTSKRIEVRFSELDMMQVVWHGSYALYFEDAREAFGKTYGLSYQCYMDNGVFAPVVDLNFHFAKPIRYNSAPRIDITYMPTEAAKVVFAYEIYDDNSGELLATGKSVQVFLDREYRLLWENPPFYVAWKRHWNVLSETDNSTHSDS